MPALDMKLVRRVVQQALDEDIGPGDVTSEATIAQEASAEAQIVCQEAGIVAGLAVAALTFDLVSPHIRSLPRCQDGELVRPGEVLIEVMGPARGILMAERVALNFLQRLSGIATHTARYVDAVVGTGVSILDTRKTAPGLRHLEKYAVAVGGGKNHRQGLYDMILIKDNHLKAAGSIPLAVQKAKAYSPNLALEVEAGNLEEVRQAMEAGADRIMLDNMTPMLMRQAVDLVRRRVTGRRPELEASGNIRLENVAEVASTGVDFISVGALTHSAAALDISLTITRMVSPGCQEGTR